MRRKHRILLTGGGSGGHIIPNFAVAETIIEQSPKTKLIYIGSRNPLDAQLVQKFGIPFYGIYAGKIRRYFSWKNFTDPFFVIIGCIQSIIILLKFRPSVVFSKGGYVSLPVVFAAFVMRYPIILHESDSRMGLANKISAKLAHKVCVSFPNLIGKKYVLTGNPIRQEIKKGDRQTGYSLTNFNKNRPVVLIWGGSQGAEEINQIIQREFHNLKKHFQIIHITGSSKKTNIHDPSYCQFDYLGDELKHIYSITDFVVGRAGANSLFELAFLQKPNIVIPLSNADQKGNAEYFTKKGASLLLEEKHNLYNTLTALYNNPEKQKEMKTALSAINQSNSAEEIAKMLLN